MKCDICGEEDCSFLMRMRMPAAKAANAFAPTTKKEPLQTTSIVLVDTNHNVVNAFEAAFKNHPDVVIIRGSITDQKTDAWVSPTNGKGNMSGGVDAAIKGKLGAYVELDLKAQINALYAGTLPVGRAIYVRTNSISNPRFVVATPTMMGDNDDVSRTKNAALACAAVFQAIYTLRDLVGNVKSIAIPGLGSGTGKMSPERCAKLMLVGYLLFKEKRYATFEEMEKDLYSLLEKMDVLTPAKPKELFGVEKAQLKKSISTGAEIGYDKAYALLQSARLTTRQRWTLKALDQLTNGISAPARPMHVALKVNELVASKYTMSDPSSWGSDKLLRLKKKGLVERVGGYNGRYSLTSSGRQVVQAIT